jgi:hypothetical protein
VLYAANHTELWESLASGCATERCLLSGEREYSEVREFAGRRLVGGCELWQNECTCRRRRINGDVR